MTNLSLPTHQRYQPKDLQTVFGYDNLYRPVIEVEIATMKTLAEIGVIPAHDISTLTTEIEEALLAITTTEVDRVERTDTPEYGKKTGHDVRAIVRVMQPKVSPGLRRWIHVPLTSYDALDTARALQFKRGHETVRKLTNQVIKHFIKHVDTHATRTQIGRTHGQHALPITVGFWLATTLSRILVGIQDANHEAENLTGKISGAVGAYNAQVSLGISERCGDKTFEQRVLEKVGLKPAIISTQILPPEPIANYLFACLKLSGALGQFGLDCRQLMRTEIGEVTEPFEEGQVASSTMANKRNPINFENLNGSWSKNKIEFGKVLECMTSEHQRDLTGSSIMRDFPIIVVNLVLQLTTLLREAKGRSFIERLNIDEASLKRNLVMQGDFILGEPLYITLQMAGYEGDAHELVNHTAMPYAQKHGVSLLQATEHALEITDGDEAKRIWANIPPGTLEILRNPERYVGAAAEKASEIARRAEVYLATQ